MISSCIYVIQHVQDTVKGKVNLLLIPIAQLPGGVLPE